MITGGAGFIGSAVVRLLVGAGHNVANVDSLTYASSLTSLESVSGSPNYQLFEVDICDRTAVRTVFEAFAPERVIHLAAETHVDRSIDDPAVFIDTNVLGTSVLLEEATRLLRSLPSDRAEEFRFVHVSTDEVFGSLGDSGHFTLTTAYRPRSPYAASKAAADHLVRAWYHTFGLPTIITNCTNNYGPYQFPEKLIPRMVIRALRGESLPVYGTGSNVREWLHVDDHAKALALVSQEGKAGATYLVGSGHESSNLDLVRLIAHYLDELAPATVSFTEKIEFVEDRPGHDHRYSIDSSQFSKELGWHPEASFESGIRNTVTWYLTNRAWWEPLVAARYGGERLGLQRGEA